MNVFPSTYQEGHLTDMKVIDITSIPRKWLSCRAWQHAWDHGPAPLQEDRSVQPVVWVTRAHCVSCATKRWRYFRVGDALPISGWDYEHPADWRWAMHGVTQMEARAELARRDIAGEKEGNKIASIRKTVKKTSRAIAG
jgi:hypothetical protein